MSPSRRFIIPCMPSLNRSFSAQMDHVPTTYIDVIREVVEEQRKCGGGPLSSRAAGHHDRGHMRRHPWARHSSANGRGTITFHTRASKVRIRPPSTPGGDAAKASFMPTPKGRRHCGGIAVRPHSFMGGGGIVIMSPTTPGHSMRGAHT